MNDGNRRNQHETPTRLQASSAAADGGQPLRIDLGQWRFTFWHDDRAPAEVRGSFWQSPGLYARRLARKR
jgi:hypothetical protein